MTELLYDEIHFIGRQNQLDIFQNMLTDPRTDEWILYLIGPGGIGKTQLLLKYINLTNRYRESGQVTFVTNNLIDLFWTAHRRQEIILKSLAEQLDPETFLPFKNAFQHYEDYLKKPHRDADVEHQLMTRTRQSFLDCYSMLQADHILIAFDTVEEASNPAILFLTEFLPEMHARQPNTRVAIAGRVRSDQQELLEKFPPGAVRRIDLRGLNDQEVSQYFSDKGYEFDEETATKLAWRCKGRPLYIALTVDWLKNGNAAIELLDKSDEEFDRSMIERVAQLDFPVDWILLAMAHVYRHFDEEIMQVIIGQMTEKETADKIDLLKKFSFVKYRPPLAVGMPGTLVLHDLMRELITKYLLNRTIDSSGGMRRIWSHKMVDYYIEKEQNSTETEKRTLSEDHLFYLLEVELQEGYQYYLKLFEGAMAGGGSATADFMDGLNHELEPWVDKLSNEQRATWELNKAIAMQKREIAITFSPQEEAIKLLERLLENPYLNRIQHASLRYRLVQAYNRLGVTQVVKLSETGEQATLPRTIFVGAPDIAKGSGDWYRWYEKELAKSNLPLPQHGWLLAEFGRFLTSVGVAFRSQYRLLDAASFYINAKERYEQALLLLVVAYPESQYQVEIANVQNNLGYVYYRLGRFDEAVAQCSAALDIRRRVSRYDQLGFSYNVIGMIRVEQTRVNEAVKSFEQGLKAFELAESDRGRGQVLVSYGRFMRQWGWYEEEIAGEGFTADRDKYNRAAEMLENAIRIFHELKDPSNLAEALNERGTLYRCQRMWMEALDCYTESIELYENQGNHYRVVDNYTDIGILYDRQSKHERSEEKRRLLLDEVLKNCGRACEKAREINAYYLLAKAQRSIADAHFSLGHYDQAFEAAADACAYIMRLDPERLGESAAKREMEYDSVVSWVKNLLIHLDSRSMMETKTDQLIERWKTEVMDPAHNRKLSDEYPGFITAMLDTRRDYEFIKNKEAKDL